MAKKMASAPAEPCALQELLDAAAATSIGARLLDEPALAFCRFDGLEFTEADFFLEHTDAATAPHLGAVLAPFSRVAPRPSSTWSFEEHVRRKLAPVWKRYLEAMRAEPYYSEEHAPVPAPPTESRALAAWGKEHRVEPLLATPAAVALAAAPSRFAEALETLPEHLSLAAAVVATADASRPAAAAPGRSRGGPEPRRARREAQSASKGGDTFTRQLVSFAHFARMHLHTHALLAARARAATAARRRAWAVTRLEGAAAQLSAVLQQTLAQLTAVHDPPLGLPRGDLAFDERSLAARWEAAARDRGHLDAYVAELDLRAWRDGGLSPTCTCGEEAGPCAHKHALVAALVDVLHRPNDALGVEIATTLVAPPWRRSLRALDKALAACTTRREGASRLSWRLRMGRRDDHETFSLVPYLRELSEQHRGWSEGRVVMPEALDLASIAPFPGGEEVLQLVRGASDEPVPFGIFRSLELLAGYEELVLAQSPRKPLEVRRGRAGLVLEETETGALRLMPAVDGDVALGRALAARLSYGRRLILVDPVASLCTLVELEASEHKLLTACAEDPPEIPAGGEAELASRLEALENHLAITLPARLEGEELPAEGCLHVRLTPYGPDGLHLQMLVRPVPGGPAIAAGSGPERFAAYRDGKRVYAKRDRAAEERAVVWLKSHLPLGDAASFPRPGEIALPDSDAALATVATLRDLADSSSGSGGAPDGDGDGVGVGAGEAECPALVVEWAASAKPWRVRRARLKHLFLGARSEQELLDLHGFVEVDGERVELAVLVDAVRRSIRFIPVRGGTWIALSDELRARLGRILDASRLAGDKLLVSPAAALAYDDLFDETANAALASEWQAQLQSFRDAAASTPAMPASLQCELRPYQLEGFRHLMRLASLRMGACLADDMGLGKTVQTLAVLTARAALGPSMVVAPTSVCFNWEREAHRFAPSLRPLSLREVDTVAPASLGPGDVLVATYGLLLRRAEELRAIRFATLVLDEAQAVKNAATKRARAVRDLSVDWRVALTGTPIENHVGELWSLFRILNPGLLGSLEHFRERFATPIAKNRDPERRAALAQLVRPFVLRRTKAQVAPELPARTEVRCLVALSPEERELYDSARVVIMAELAGVADAIRGDAGRADEERFAVLAAITRLRQLACHPQLYDPALATPSSKLARFCELVFELRENGHRALVFSQFTRHLALARDALAAAGVSFLYLDGETPEHERIRRVDLFQAGTADVFLISLRAGGTGLNLTAADYVIHLDPWWNPAVEDQATDRAHRIGQVKPVTVYRLVAQGTIEEAILALHDEKRELAESVLAGADAAGRLSTADLLALIRDGAAGLTRDDGDAD